MRYFWIHPDHASEFMCPSRTFAAATAWRIMDLVRKPIRYRIAWSKDELCWHRIWATGHTTLYSGELSGVGLVAALRRRKCGPHKDEFKLSLSIQGTQPDIVTHHASGITTVFHPVERMRYVTDIHDALAQARASTTPAMVLVYRVVDQHDPHTGPDRACRNLTVAYSLAQWEQDQPRGQLSLPLGR